MIVLDTHAFLWWATAPEKLGRTATKRIAAATRLGVPAICLWEIAMKVTARKLRFDRSTDAWIDAALAADHRVELLAITPRIAVDCAELSWTHRDPADRFIVATARALDAPLVTADETIHSSKLVRCVWD